MEFPIKNMVLYVSGDKVLTTSLHYGNYHLYTELDAIYNNSGIPTYILCSKEKTSNNTYHYCLSAYIIRKDGIEETNFFPNGESSITIRCYEKDLETCLEIEDNGNLHKNPIFGHCSANTCL